MFRRLPHATALSVPRTSNATRCRFMAT